MKKHFLFWTLLLSVFTGFAQVWKSDPAHSKLSFSTVHMGISDVSGRFNKFEATINATKKDFSDASVELKVDVSSINTDVEQRDNHLKSPDFFDVAKFPEMSFKSTGITRIEGNKYQLTGDLTLHGVTRPVSMVMEYRGTVQNPQSKKDIAGFQVTGTIQRSDFGIGNKFPSAMISEAVQIRADGEFSQP
ncbi:YceI family protein [Pseudoflavitalea rhizosphaerae]|uniref:YceI family protein n=1 Tax=Pseudoflavitalea rhizosphaerae TaxID=1884793 RepID=UPI000F8E8059|nr:YceI family protein [Pseudoflavitalea rhizosphaerae]